MKYHYSADKNNSLLFKTLRSNQYIPVQGRFSVSKNNQLIFWLNEPVVWIRENNLPSKITFRGQWRLNSEHDLELYLDKTKSQYKGDYLTLKGTIISTDRDTLTFELSSVDKKGQVHLGLIKLSGTWQADEYNRINFSVTKLPLADILIFKGSWQLDKFHQIIYHYEKQYLKTKTRALNSLTFEGYWQINSGNRLTYILKHTSDSRFDFRAQIETPTIYPQKGLIKYRLGLGVGEDKSEEQTILLYGTWKFSRNLKMAFEVDYGDGGLKSIEFAADVTFQKNIATFSLKSQEGEPLGITVTFTHKFLKELDAQAFLRLKARKDESAIEVGLRIPF